MSSIDFDKEKNTFRDYYDANIGSLETAKNSFVALVESLTKGSISISKIEGRVKNREECIKKFNLKYRTALEEIFQHYTIKDHISDLIGLRVVCLYEDDVEKLKIKLSQHFLVIDVTDKISQIEDTEDSFGYKGLHLDLKLNEIRCNLPEYEVCKDLSFEVQIRTIIQDSWSVLDHKIKYKKAIPKHLKRRINTLAALFELADREFKEIRIATDVELEKTHQQAEYISDTTPGTSVIDDLKTNEFNAFSFLKIANHFFSDFKFESYKVDGFTQEIVALNPQISRGKLNFYIRETITAVKKYKIYFDASSTVGVINPYTVIRHCLYLGDKEVFSSMLNASAKRSFEKWLIDNPYYVD